MKFSVAFLCLIGILFSCGKETEKEHFLFRQIQEYVETDGNVRTDMSFEILKVEEIEPYYKGEQLEHRIVFIAGQMNYKGMYTEDRARSLELYSSDLSNDYEFYEDSSNLAKVIDVVQHGSSYSDEINFRGKLMSLVEENLLNLAELQNLNNNKEKPHFRNFNITYSIVNPLENNSKQTITEQFWLDVELNRVEGSGSL